MLCDDTFRRRPGSPEVVGSVLPWERLADEGISLSDLLAARSTSRTTLPACGTALGFDPRPLTHRMAPGRLDEAVRQFRHRPAATGWCPTMIAGDAVSSSCRLTRTRPPDGRRGVAARDSSRPRRPSAGWSSSCSSSACRSSRSTRIPIDGLAFDLLSEPHRPGHHRPRRRPHHDRPRRGRRRPSRGGRARARRGLPHDARPLPPRDRPLLLDGAGRRRRGPARRVPRAVRRRAGRLRRGARRPLRQRAAPTGVGGRATSAPTPPCTRGRTGPRPSPTTSTSATRCRPPRRTEWPCQVRPCPGRTLGR